MIVGQRLRRLDAAQRVTGRTTFSSDSDLQGTLFGGVLRSPHAHARINRLECTRAREVAGVRAVITAADIPGRNVLPLIQSDWPVLAGEFVRHYGEAVALVAAESPEALAAGLEAVVVDYEVLPALVDLEEALVAGEVMAQYRVRRGEAALAMEQSGVIVVEATYRTPHQDHGYLEPQVVVAEPEGDGGVLVTGSMESPFHVQRAVASVLRLDLGAVRVVPTTAGGGFGGKEDLPACLGAQAALLARATGRPCRIALTRREDLSVSSKRHPARVRVRAAASEGGHLVAAEVDLVLDGGAYATLSPLVLFRSAVHACGPYRIPNVRVDARVVRTHKPPSGGFRGYGIPQVAFAWEGQMDLLAARLGMDPLQFRRQNALEVGDETITGQRLGESVGLQEALESVGKASDWDRKRETFARDPGPLKRGIGIAASYAGIGLGAVGKQPGACGAALVVLPDGSVSVTTGIAETGQGIATVLAQIAAEALGCPLELVRVEEGDTCRLAESGPAPAGRATFMAGLAVSDAASRIRAAMRPLVAESGLPWKESVELCLKRQVGLSAYGFAPHPETSFDLGTGQGAPYAGYSFGAAVAEVSVDTETGETRVLRIHSVLDAGRLLNPSLAEAQAEGCVLQGLGFALLEEMVLDGGRPRTVDLGSYLLPNLEDAPEIRASFVEHVHSLGPFGAKSLSDVAVAAVAPAIAAAISNATSAYAFQLPATPERVLRAITEARGRDG